MKAIVFGGSGFLGSHVADALLAAGHDVAIFDIRPSTYLVEGQEMIIGDMLDSQAVNKAMQGMDVVYNLAGIADLDDASTQPIETVRHNILGNAILLEAAWKNNIKRYVYASTVYVYSDLGGFYRCSKQAAEIYIEEYQRKWGLEYTILRYGSLYGPRADQRNSIYRYLRQALTENRITCYGTGQEVREYINVLDAARLSVEILRSEFTNRHMIITGHHPMKFLDMLEMVKEMMGNSINIELKPAVNHGHYNITPYTFNPKVGQKFVGRYYLDMGQGLLECLNELYHALEQGGEESHSRSLYLNAERYERNTL